MRRLPTAGETALLIMINLQRYAKDRGKALNQFRMSRSSLRRISIRSRLEETWVDSFIEHMIADFRWLVFIESDDFLFLKQNRAASWTKISSKRCANLILRLEKGDDSALDDAEAEFDADGINAAEDEDDGD